MYLDWVLDIVAILLIVFLVYAIYRLYNTSEGFALVQTPNQTYTIPILTGVIGRYVRIRPSITSGDGYLTISQIKVIDINGNNIALKKPVTATSRDGSPVDQKYGRTVRVGDVNMFRSGISDGPSCVTDGVLIPRNTLENVFETGVQNQSPAAPTAPDNQYLEIDLSGNNIISQIVYIGRGDAQTRTIQTIDATLDYLTQVDRIKGMRVEIRDTAGELTFGGPGMTAAMFTTTASQQTMKISNELLTVNANLGSSAAVKDTIPIPNVSYYKAIANVFYKAAPLTAPPVSTDPAAVYVPDINPGENNKELIQKLYSPTYASLLSMDISNNILPSILLDHPISFFNDVYVPAGCTASSPPTFCRSADVTAARAGSSTISIEIFGTAEPLAKEEMLQSIELCKKLYIGSPSAVENYVRISYSTDPKQILPYFRGSCSSDTTQPKLGASDLVQIFQTNDFVTQAYPANVAWNAANFSCPVIDSGSGSSSGSGSGSGKRPTSKILGLIPFASRQFLVEWIYNRTGRYISYTTKSTTAAMKAEYMGIIQYWNNLYSDRERNIRQSINTLSPMPGITWSSDPDVLYQQVQNPSHNMPSTLRTSFRTSYSAYLAYLAATENSLTNTSKIVIPTYIDIRSTVIMDAIAQQFYEILGGQFSMIYIFDAFPLGSTMLDVRFELNIHNDVVSSYGPLNALKAQYKKIISAKTQTKDVLNTAAVDYENARLEAEEGAMNDTLKPFEGAVVRIFYKKAGNSIKITGLIFDANAVTSFLTEMNGGIPVPLGPEPGNVNYQPKVVYTKNKTEPLDCSNPDTLKRIMTDYVRMMEDPVNNYPLSKASPPMDVKKGALTVTQVIGSQKVSDVQCAVTWKESLYDFNTNALLPIESKGSGSGSGSSPALTEVTRNALISYKKDTSGWFAFELDIDSKGFKFYSTPTVPQCVFNPEYYKSLNPNRYGSTSGSTIIRDFITNDFKDGITPICPDAIPNYVFDPTAAGSQTLEQYMQTGIYNNYVVRPAQPIVPFSTPLLITKSLPSQTTLDNLSNLCPTTTCQDMDILYDIVEQYNADPTLPGTILSVTHASTPNLQQCDIKASINYGGTIASFIPTERFDAVTGITTTTYKPVLKGGVTYNKGSDNKITEGSKPMTYTGEYKDITIAMYVVVDPTTCKYKLVDASGQNSGHSIQANTPELYTPMIYTDQMIKRKIGKLGSSGQLALTGETGSAINTIQTDFTNALGSTKQILKDYRIQSYNAAGAANSLSVCANKLCSESSIQNMMKDYYKNTVARTGEQIDTILRTSSVDGKSCDATFTTTSDRTVTNRFMFSPTCSINGHTGADSLLGNNANRGVVAQVTDAQLLDIKKELSTTYKESFVPYKNPSVSAFTNYSPTYKVSSEALDVRGFGKDSGRNADYSMKDAQFETPLVQKIPAQRKAAPPPPSYRFIRFTPIRTRAPNAPAVNVGKFVFFYKWEPLLLSGTVTNPMGTWEGSMADVTGPGSRPGWSDHHKKSLTFAFREPIAVDGYSITTALPEMGIEGDPVSWKLEGSTNGTFWKILDTQMKFATPVTRFQDIDVIYI